MGKLTIGKLLLKSNCYGKKPNFEQVGPLKHKEGNTLSYTAQHSHGRIQRMNKEQSATQLFMSDTSAECVFFLRYLSKQRLTALAPAPAIYHTQGLSAQQYLTHVSFS